MEYLLRAKQVFTGSDVLEDQVIVCSNGTIDRVEPWRAQAISAQYDCLAPGFIDIHINGGRRYYFTAHPEEESLEDIELSCLANGTVYTLPTLITSSFENMFRGIKSVRDYINKYPQSGILGLHLEGPFLHPMKRGAHMAKFLQTPTDDAIEKIISEGEGIVKMITIAPELFSDSQLSTLINSGIVVSAGHSNASYEEAQHAFDRGINVVTHLFNAMSPFTHRAPGLTGAALLTRNIYTPVIVDGIHCHFSSAELAYRLKKDKFFLISDALFVDQGVKEFQWAEFDAKFVEGKYINSEGNLAGASISIGDAVRNCVEKLGVPLQEAIGMATLRPARAIGIEDKYGRIAAGYPAQFTVFDNNLHHFTSVSGK